MREKRSMGSKGAGGTWGRRDQGEHREHIEHGGVRNMGITGSLGNMGIGNMRGRGSVLVITAPGRQR